LGKNRTLLLRQNRIVQIAQKILAENPFFTEKGIYYPIYLVSAKTPSTLKNTYDASVLDIFCIA